jgi:TrmH family RNA methyltransferase
VTALGPEGGPLDHVSIVLVRPQQPSNVGTAARAIANHGLGRLVLVDPPGFDPERARWMAPGAHEVIDQARFVRTVAEAVADRERVVATSGRWRRWTWPRWGPSELQGTLLAAPVPTAILFGPEDSGLSNEDLLRVDAMLVLPTAGHASLNLGQAVTVCAASLAAAASVARSATAPPRAPRAPAEHRDRVTREAMEVLEHTGYLKGRSAEQVQSTMFRLLGRADLESEEIMALLGMLKSVRYPLGLHVGRKRD